MSRKFRMVKWRWFRLEHIEDRDKRLKYVILAGYVISTQSLLAGKSLGRNRNCEEKNYVDQRENIDSC